MRDVTIGITMRILVTESDIRWADIAS
jgi:hypothetical protein